MTILLNVFHYICILQYDSTGRSQKENMTASGASSAKVKGEALASGYVWDEASGYYYDAASGFYYDPNRGKPKAFSEWF